ncbi:hypothetical protein ACQEUU_37290 [Nonomuraea sp. CA-218870]|uniref:hypothetical protein n=1 Tax=Nonomuraea sp. CA-218870 TaxID=3239998 RepID=UPI003D90BB15
MGGETRPKWVTVLHGFWLIFALPAQSYAAKFCKFWIVAGCVFLVLEAAAPGVGESYLSRAYLADVADAVVDVMVWYLALWFVRERDEARAEVKALDAAHR